MAVLHKCSCGSLYSVRHEKCPLCGKKMNRSGDFRVDVKHKGQRVTKNVKGISRAKEVERALKSALVSEEIFGVSIIAERKSDSVTVKEFFETCYRPLFETTVKNKSNLSTVEGYFKKWIFPLLGSKRLAEITVSDVERVKQEVLKAGRSPRTVEHVLALLKALLNKAVEMDLFRGNNPVSRVKIPKYDNKRTRFLSEEEAEALLAECRKRTTSRNWIYPIVLLALSTGMRAGEIFSLKWQDVDFENGIIHVRDPKNSKNRIAYMSDELRAVLIEHQKKVDTSPSAYVFPRKGGPMKAVPDVFKNIVKDLGFNKGVTDPREKVVFHTLRHTFCSWLAKEGVPLHVIKELAGHSSIQVTERYAHLLPDVKQEAAKKVWRKLNFSEE